MPPGQAPNTPAMHAPPGPVLGSLTYLWSTQGHVTLGAAQETFLTRLPLTRVFKSLGHALVSSLSLSLSLSLVPCECECPLQYTRHGTLVEWMVVQPWHTRVHSTFRTLLPAARHALTHIHSSTLRTVLLTEPQCRAALNKSQFL